MAKKLGLGSENWSLAHFLLLIGDFKLVNDLQAVQRAKKLVLGLMKGESEENFSDIMVRSVVEEEKRAFFVEKHA